MENNASQTDAPSINHSEEAAGLFKQLLQLYQHLGGMATGTRERETATTQDTFNSWRTKSRLVAHTNVSSAPPPPPGLHFHLQKKTKQKKGAQRAIPRLRVGLFEAWMPHLMKNIWQIHNPETEMCSWDIMGGREREKSSQRWIDRAS